MLFSYVLTSTGRQTTLSCYLEFDDNPLAGTKDLELHLSNHHATFVYGFDVREHYKALSTYLTHVFDLLSDACEVGSLAERTLRSMRLSNTILSRNNSWEEFARSFEYDVEYLPEVQKVLNALEDFTQRFDVYFNVSGHE